MRDWFGFFILLGYSLVHLALFVFFSYVMGLIVECFEGPNWVGWAIIACLYAINILRDSLR